MHVFMNAFEFMIELLDGKVLDDSSVFTASWPLHAVFVTPASSSQSTIIRAVLQLKTHGLSVFPWCHT